jgi:hypothetical protein
MLDKNELSTYTLKTGKSTIKVNFSFLNNSCNFTVVKEGEMQKPNGWLQFLIES